jgi:hypothetical protein
MAWKSKLVSSSSSYSNGSLSYLNVKNAYSILKSMQTTFYGDALTVLLSGHLKFQRKCPMSGLLFQKGLIYWKFLLIKLSRIILTEGFLGAQNPNWIESQRNIILTAKF